MDHHGSYMIIIYTTFTVYHCFILNQLRPPTQNTPRKTSPPCILSIRTATPPVSSPVLAVSPPRLGHGGLGIGQRRVDGLSGAETDGDVVVSFGRRKLPSKRPEVDTRCKTPGNCLIKDDKAFFRIQGPARPQIDHSLEVRTHLRSTIRKGGTCMDVPGPYGQRR